MTSMVLTEDQLEGTVKVVAKSHDKEGAALPAADVGEGGIAVRAAGGRVCEFRKRKGNGQHEQNCKDA